MASLPNSDMLAVVRAVGVDLSAEDKKTWMASLDVGPRGATVVELMAQVGNVHIVEAASTADKLGIDCPFGWPVAFQQFLNEHMSGPVSPRVGAPLDWRRHLAYRETDRFVTEQTGLRPLSVAADRIAHAAMRCAALLAELTRAGVPVDRTGVDGSVVEVYPAASLLRWRLTHRRYRRVERGRRSSRTLRTTAERHQRSRELRGLDSAAESRHSAQPAQRGRGHLAHLWQLGGTGLAPGQASSRRTAAGPAHNAARISSCHAKRTAP